MTYASAFPTTNLSASLQKQPSLFSQSKHKFNLIRVPTSPRLKSYARVIHVIHTKLVYMLHQCSRCQENLMESNRGRRGRVKPRRNARVRF